MVRKVRLKQNEQTVKGKGFLYIPKHNLVYARIPKCANTSIKTTLSELVKVSTAKNPRTARTLQPTNDRFWKQCTTEAMFLKPDKYTAIRKKVFTFTFIREPLQRLHSCYREKIRRPSILNERSTWYFSISSLIISSAGHGGGRECAGLRKLVETGCCGVEGSHRGELERGNPRNE